MEQLSDESRKVLRALLSKKMLRGRDLSVRTELTTPEELIKAVRPLVDRKLVKTSDRGCDPEAVFTSRFYLPPSAVRSVEHILSGKW